MRRARTVIVLCALGAEVAPLLAQATRDSVVYRLSPASRLEVTTGKAGLLGFVGHEHTIRAAATFSVNQTDFGITPFRGGPGGTVRVADRVTFQIAAIAVRED